jgi:hypothetical protein
MIILVLVLVLLGIFAGAAGMRRLGRWARSLPGTWRPGMGGAALLSLLGGLGLAARGGVLEGLILILLAAPLAVLARRRPRRPPPPDAAPLSGMSLAEARDILGLGVAPTPAEIQAAHRRLMARVHPDVGGANGLAVQLNRARDRLLQEGGAGR